MDIITRLAKISSEHARSSKGASLAIVSKGQSCFNAVWSTALDTKGLLSRRCAEACARAARIKPEYAQANSRKIIELIANNSRPEIGYYLVDMLLGLQPDKPGALECGRVIHQWLKSEKGLGPRAAYLEAIVALSQIEPKLEVLADGLLDEALASSIPSYSARARQIIKRGLDKSFRTRRV